MVFVFSFYPQSECCVRFSCGCVTSRAGSSGRRGRDSRVRAPGRARAIEDEACLEGGVEAWGDGEGLGVGGVWKGLMWAGAATAVIALGRFVHTGYFTSTNKNESNKKKRRVQRTRKTRWVPPLCSYQSSYHFFGTVRELQYAVDIYCCLASVANLS